MILSQESDEAENIRVGKILKVVESSDSDSHRKAYSISNSRSHI